MERNYEAERLTREQALYGTRYSWLAVSVDPKEKPVTGRCDPVTDFWEIRAFAEEFVKGSRSFDGRTLAAMHILDAYGQVVWTGLFETNG